MACNLKNVLSSGAQCTESPAGLSNHVFVVPFDAEHIKKIGIHDGANEYYILPAGTGKALKGFRIDFKSQTGQVTSEPNPSGSGWAHTGTGRVEMNEDEMAYVSRSLHNSDKYLYFFPTGKTTSRGAEYKVVGNQFGEAEWSVSADSGVARSDDHGQTFTVTCGFQVYPVMKWFGTIVQETNPSSSNFLDNHGDDIVFVDGGGQQVGGDSTSSN
jgi:hypothetical protein